MDDLKKGRECELLVEKLVFGGKAMARVEGLVVFIDHAVPGQRVRVLITKKKRQYCEARVVEVLSQSPGYVEPFCPHFGVCGGCQWQDITYDEQLKWKRIHVADSLEHLAGAGGVTVEDTVPSERMVYYRNKMEFTFSDRLWLTREQIEAAGMRDAYTFTLGLHVRSWFDKVFNVETCFLESAAAVEILKAVRTWGRQSGIPPYSIKSQHGYWRFLVIREGKRTGQTLVHLVTSDQPEHEEAVKTLTQHLVSRFPHVSTVVHSVSQKKAQVAYGDRSRVTAGPGVIEEQLGTLRFRVSADSFFQTNPFAAEKLYESVSELAAFDGTETVWDLYCGTGSIALFIASQVHAVVGFEVVDQAIEDAYVNARLNGIENARFISGDLKERIKLAREQGSGVDVPDVVITDPPRAGMHPHVVNALLEMAPARIVYVSCNPATLARDLAFFMERYEIKTVRPFDLFPHTPHIECVVRLDRK
jgi:23S rRNA (uracil1939-C5)-methyltransferase